MRIFISADWHLGKRLHQEDLSEDMELFFAFLLEKIRGKIFVHFKAEQPASR